MDEPHGQPARGRRVDGPPAPDEAAALHKVVAFLQFGDEFGRILDGVLIVAVDGQHALVPARERKVQPHAQLRALAAAAGFDKQRVDAVELERVWVHASVGGAAVAQDDVGGAVDARLLRAAQLGQNARALVDDRDQQAVVAAAGGEFGNGIAHVKRLFHWNTSAMVWMALSTGAGAPGFAISIETKPR